MTLESDLVHSFHVWSMTDEEIVATILASDHLESLRQYVRWGHEYAFSSDHLMATARRNLAERGLTPEAIDWVLS